MPEIPLDELSPATTGAGRVVHTCNPAAPGRPLPFGKRGPGCLRCMDLDAGALPREGWGAQSRRDELQRAADHRSHFGPGGPHERGTCGPVCTFGDW